LEKCDGRVEDDCTLNTGLNADLDLAVVNDVAAHTLNVRGRGAVKVSGTKEGAKLEGLDLSEGGRLSIRRRICVGILVIAVAVTVTG